MTALFTHLDPLVCARLDALSISHTDDELLLTREIAADGGSAARVNGHTTTVSVLREIGDALINIHGQHDNQVLLAPECHLQILDAFGGDDTLLHQYQDTFRQLQQTAKRLNHLAKQEQDKAHRRQQLKALVAEVDELGLEQGEEEALEEELNLLQHAESIAAALQAAAEAIDGEDADGSAVLLTEAAAEELSPFSDMRAEFAVLGERLAAAGIELADIASECRSLRDGMDLDPQRYAMVQKRMLETNRVKAVSAFRLPIDGSHCRIQKRKSGTHLLDMIPEFCGYFCRVAHAIESRSYRLVVVIRASGANGAQKCDEHNDWRENCDQRPSHTFAQLFVREHRRRGFCDHACRYCHQRPPAVPNSFSLYAGACTSSR